MTNYELLSVAFGGLVGIVIGCLLIVLFWTVFYKIKGD